MSNEIARLISAVMFAPGQADLFSIAWLVSVEDAGIGFLRFIHSARMSKSAA